MVLIYSLILLSLFPVFFFGFSRVNELNNLGITNQILIDGSENELFDLIIELKKRPTRSPFKRENSHIKFESLNVNVICKTHSMDENIERFISPIKYINELKVIELECGIKYPFEALVLFEYGFDLTIEGILVTQRVGVKARRLDAYCYRISTFKEELQLISKERLRSLKERIENEKFNDKIASIAYQHKI